MVRFIIFVRIKHINKILDLHSNMVRFIILISLFFQQEILVFTFQYGQIYYLNYLKSYFQIVLIYIPIWLDLLFEYELIYKKDNSNLHSNMVRFIINKRSKMIEFVFIFTFQYGQIYYTKTRARAYYIASIYIPIWLDLL